MKNKSLLAAIIAVCILFHISGCSKPISKPTAKPIKTQEVTLRFINEKGEVDSPYIFSIELIEQPGGQERVYDITEPMIGSIENGQLKKHIIIGATYEIRGTYYGKTFIQKVTVKENQKTIDIKMNGKGK